jgi:hypothetical protein
MSSTQLYLEAKKILRLHPGLKDEEVAERCGILPHALAFDGPGSPLGVIRTARKDNGVDGGYEERTDHGGDRSWLPG